MRPGWSGLVIDSKDGPSRPRKLAVLERRSVATAWSDAMRWWQLEIKGGFLGFGGEGCGGVEAREAGWNVFVLRMLMVRIWCGLVDADAEVMRKLVMDDVWERREAGMSVCRGRKPFFD
jgi:hypothetical protein